MINTSTVSTQDPEIPKGDYLDIPTVPALIYIPENTVKLIVVAKIMDDDDTIREATMIMSVAEVADARIDGDEWEQNNAVYTLTDKAREELDII